MTLNLTSFGSARIFNCCPEQKSQQYFSLSICISELTVHYKLSNPVARLYFLNVWTLSTRPRGFGRASECRCHHRPRWCFRSPSGLCPSAVLPSPSFRGLLRDWCLLASSFSVLGHSEVSAAPVFLLSQRRSWWSRWRQYCRCCWGRGRNRTCYWRQSLGLDELRALGNTTAASASAGAPFLAGILKLIWVGSR